MKNKNIKVGDRVTCRKPVDAYYSKYAGAPECVFMPGDIGIVAAVNVPKVKVKGSFVVVDFEKKGVVYNRKTGSCIWRVGLNYDNIVCF